MQCIRILILSKSRIHKMEKVLKPYTHILWNEKKTRTILLYLKRVHSNKNKKKWKRCECVCVKLSSVQNTCARDIVSFVRFTFYYYDENNMEMLTKYIIRFDSAIPLSRKQSFSNFLRFLPRSFFLFCSLALYVFVSFPFRSTKQSTQNLSYLVNAGAINGHFIVCMRYCICSISFSLFCLNATYFDFHKMKILMLNTKKHTLLSNIVYVYCIVNSELCNIYNEW